MRIICHHHHHRHLSSTSDGSGSTSSSSALDKKPKPTREYLSRRELQQEASDGISLQRCGTIIKPALTPTHILRICKVPVAASAAAAGARVMHSIACQKPGFIHASTCGCGM
jgi:hypothetical protein